MKKIIFPDSVRRYMDLQCNGDESLYTEFPEHKAVDPILRDMKPKVALDIGCGIGRASVWFAMHYGWTDTKFYLYDGDHGDVQYDGIRQAHGEFYNSLKATRDFAEANGLKYELLNAEKKHRFSEPIVDVAYSFLAFGFHWPINYALKRVDNMLKPGCVCVFGIRGLEKVGWISKQVKERPNGYGLTHIDLCPTQSRESILVMEKMQ